MPALYRPEPLIPASIQTAVVNLGILRTQATVRRTPLTPAESKAAIRMAVELSRIVERHAMGRER